MTFRVEVVYAFRHACYAAEVQVEAGATVADAVRAALALEPFKSLRVEPPPDPEKVGIFGRAAMPDTPLSAGDRVELYRDLAQDPREQRRARAAPPKTGGEFNQSG